MLKKLTTKQIKALDAYTIKHRPIDSIDLMENACHEIAMWLMERYNSTYKIGIVCGTGNNGGDGLGVARMLNAAGYAVAVWIVKGGVAESADFQVNFSRLQ